LPTILKSKKISDKRVDKATQLISKKILTFAKFLLSLVAITFTNASPTFITVSEISVSVIPNPRVVVPKRMSIILTKYKSVGIYVIKSMVLGIV